MVFFSYAQINLHLLKIYSRISEGKSQQKKKHGRHVAWEDPGASPPPPFPTHTFLAATFFS